jgi:hypothetical protein
MRPTIQDDDSSQYAAILARLQRLEQALPLATEDIRFIGESGEPGFENGYDNYDTSTFTAAGFRRDRGLVHLQGVVARTGTPSTAVTIFTLPSAYWPPLRTVLLVATGETFAAGRVDVLVTGEVQWLVGATGEPDYVSLDGLSFPHA